MSARPFVAPAIAATDVAELPSPATDSAAIPSGIPDDYQPLTKDRLSALVRACKAQHGESYDPVLQLAAVAERAIQAGDDKTAITALNAVADRWYPRLKAVEIDTGGHTEGLIVRLNGMGLVTDAADAAVDGEYEEVKPPAEPDERPDLLG